MPVDPAPYLSTVILTSAALVAIVGGLLVARFVSLDSDGLSSRKVITDAEAGLATARQRASDAHGNLVRWLARRFIVGGTVLGEIGSGHVDLGDLRRLADCDLSDAELQPFVDEVAAEFGQARVVLAAVPAERIREADYEWDDFRTASADLPETSWPAVWAQVFERIAADVAEKDADLRRTYEEDLRRTNPMAAALSLHVPDFGPADRRRIRAMALANSKTDYVAIGERRRDELSKADQRAEQRVEDYESELNRLRQAHAEIVRPDRRMWAGVVILVLFAIAGVAVPLWVMSRGPASLAQVRWTFYLFAAGLAALLLYIVWYLRGLTRRKPNNAPSSDLAG